MTARKSRDGSVRSLGSFCIIAHYMHHHFTLILSRFAQQSFPLRDGTRSQLQSKGIGSVQRCKATLWVEANNIGVGAIHSCDLQSQSCYGSHCRHAFIPQPRYNIMIHAIKRRKIRSLLKNRILNFHIRFYKPWRPSSPRPPHAKRTGN